MQTTTGTIVVTQEGRFRIVTDEGQARLFLLAPDADLAPQDLPDLQKRQAHVTVHFTPATDLIADIAHRLTETRRPGEAP